MLNFKFTWPTKKISTTDLVSKYILSVSTYILMSKYLFHLFPNPATKVF